MPRNTTANVALGGKSLWPPRTLRDAVPFAALAVFCVIGFISPPSLMLQRVQAIKGSLILAVGILSWAGILMYPGFFWPKRFWISKALLGTFVIGILITALFSVSRSGALFGTVNDRAGVLCIFSFIGIAIVTRRLDRRLFVLSLYTTAVLLALFSIPYNFIFYGHLLRLYGLLRQPDILAVWLGCGFLFGLYIYGQYPRLRKYVVASQILLLGALLMTETRAVLLLTPLLALFYLFKTIKNRRLLLMAAIVSVCLLALFIPPFHLYSRQTSDLSVLGQDTMLRIHVQAVAVRSLLTMPFQGYGPGRIMDALNCTKLNTPDLKRVCNLHLVFTSSHNIFLDQFLELGWLGGLSFLGLSLYAIVSGLRSTDVADKVILCAFLLISLYYFTNVTTLDIEYLDWVLLVPLLFVGRVKRPEADTHQMP